MNSVQLINYDDLKEWTGIGQRNKMIDWLNNNHIAYRLNRTGFPVTTMDAINKSLESDQFADEVDF